MIDKYVLPDRPYSSELIGKWPEEEEEMSDTIRVKTQPVYNQAEEVRSEMMRLRNERDKAVQSAKWWAFALQVMAVFWLGTVLAFAVVWP